MTEPPANGVRYTTKEVVERIEDKLDHLEHRLRSVELKVAASRWLVPIVTGLLVALATGAMLKT